MNKITAVLISALMAAASYSDLDKQQWGISMVNMEKSSLTPLYEIAGEYGTMDSGRKWKLVRAYMSSC